MNAPRILYHFLSLRMALTIGCDRGARARTQIWCHNIECEDVSVSFEI